MLLFHNSQGNLWISPFAIGFYGWREREMSVPWFFPLISLPHQLSRWKIPFQHSKESQKSLPNIPKNPSTTARPSKRFFSRFSTRDRVWERVTMDLFTFWEQDHDLGRHLG